MADTPKRLGRYQLLAQLASGGMGEIHLARLEGRAGFEKLVVLKRLLPELAPSREHVSMFLDEARLAARLGHPNVCEVYDLGEDDGQCYIVMQYLEGVPFSSVMRRGDGADLLAHVRLSMGALAQACEGLHHAHELRDSEGRPLGVVHRDVSPSNLMVTSDGVVKVLDFGIAKARIGTSVTERGVLKGKLAYMSPEQLAESPVDRRADVFCLGIQAWEATVGAPLFPRESAVATARAVLEDVIPDVRQRQPATPAGLAAAIARALERDPGQRFATARELGLALTEAMASSGGVMAAQEIARVVDARFGDALRKQRALHERTASLPALPAVAAGAAAGATRLERTAPLTPATEASTRRDSPAARRVARRWWPIALGAVVLAAVVGVAIGRSGRESGGAAVAAGSRTVDAGAASVTPALDAGTRAAAGSADAAPDPPASLPSPSRRPGWVSIDSTPFAVVYVDDERVGETPLIRIELKAGKHRVRAVLADGRRKELTVKIEAGRAAPPVNLTW